MKPSDFPLGSFVRIRNQQVTGELIRIYNRHVAIACDATTIYTTIDKLELVAKQKKKVYTTKSNYNIINITATTYTQTSTTIDLHGMDKKTAIAAVDRFIDRGLLQGHRHLKIIHGKGRGILRKAVRNYLHSHSHVRKVIDQHAFQCTAGVTWVEL